MDVFPAIVPVIGVCIGITSITCCMMCKTRRQLSQLEERMNVFLNQPQQQQQAYQPQAPQAQAYQPQAQAQAQAYQQTITVPYSIPSYPYAYPRQQAIQQPTPSAPYTTQPHPQSRTII